MRVAALVLMLPGMAAAAGSVSLGLEYSRGNYGDAQPTRIWYLPFTAEYAADAYRVQLTLPYVWISGPASTVGGMQGPMRMAAGQQMSTRSASGQGDAIVAGSYNVYADSAAGLLIDLTGKLKLATADAGKGLGTGERDASLQIDVARRFGEWTAFGSLGRRKMGDPPDFTLRDPWFGSLGASRRLDERLRLGAIYDGRQAVVSGGGRLSELTVFVDYRLSPVWTVEGHLVRGFADGSPDWAAGLRLSRRY